MSKQKLYCYIDETGQDQGSDFFVVVAMLSDEEQNQLRKKIEEIEYLVKIGNRKWHKTRLERNINFLEKTISKGIGQGEIYFGRYKKPIPYFLPMLDTLERSIADKAKNDYKAIIYVDGIDRKKSRELTNALRIRKIKTGLVRSARDESEPLIRLVDRWAGCIRASFIGKKLAQNVYNKAIDNKYIIEIKNPE